MPSSPLLFPLPLTPFEHYMLVDDRPQYPMTFFIQQQFSGEMDRAAFEAALAEVRLQHPLLTAIVDRSQRRIPVWRQANELTPPVDWADLGVPIHCPQGEGIDLTRELGLRIWVRHGKHRTELTTQFHHACLDGLGSFEFLGDLLASYGARLGQTAVPRPRSIDPDLLHRRGQFKVVSTDGDRQLSFYQSMVSRISEAALTLRQRPQPLWCPPPEDRSRDFPGIRTLTVDSGPLRRAARGKGVTVNDLLLRDMFLTLREWNTAAGVDRNRWLRITMPTNLRQAVHRQCPATNILGYAFITRREADCDRPEDLLASIHHDTAAIKRWNLGAYFPESVAFVRRFPGAISVFASSRRCFSTTVLTNLGDPSRRFLARLPRRDGRVMAGNLVLEETVATPPLRPNTHAVFGVCVNGRNLTVSSRCDPHLFPNHAPQQLLDMYAAQLAKSSESPSGRDANTAPGGDE